MAQGRKTGSRRKRTRMDPAPHASEPAAKGAATGSPAGRPCLGASQRRHQYTQPARFDPRHQHEVDTPMTELTPRQRSFAEAYAACGNATEAARKAGYSFKTATSQGARLLTYANVSARITQLQAEAAERAGIEIDDVVDMLLQSYKDAKAANQHGPAVRAVELLGKTLRMFTDKISFSEEQALDDSALIDTLAAGDGHKSAMLRAVLGADDSFGGH